MRVCVCVLVFSLMFTMPVIKRLFYSYIFILLFLLFSFSTSFRCSFFLSFSHYSLGCFLLLVINLKNCARSNLIGNVPCLYFISSIVCCVLRHMKFAMQMIEEKACPINFPRTIVV